jgi:hypothetical protein
MGLRDFLRRAFASGGSGDPRDAGDRSADRDDADGQGVDDRRARGDAALRDGLRLRLVSVDSLPTVEGLPHLRAVAPGVVEVLTLDLGDRVMLPPTEQVSPLGSPSDLVDLGREQLRGLVGPGLHRREVKAQDGLRFCFAHGRGSATSSLALVLPSVLAFLEPGVDVRRGVAVAVPDGQHLAYRTIDGLESIMALGPMAAFTRNGFDDADPGISPEVYWARGPRLDQWEQLTRQSSEGIEIHVPAALTALVEED